MSETPATFTQPNPPVDEEEEDIFQEEETLASPPLHLHVAEGALLPPKATTTSTTGISSRSSSRSRTSRHSHSSSRSPSPHHTPSSTPLSAASVIVTNTNLRHSHPLQHRRIGSSGSSSEEAAGGMTMGTNLNPSEASFSLDDDIFTDKMGMLELEPPSPDHSLRGGSTSSMGGGTYLPSVNERMSEETLEDVHAFSDVHVLTNMLLGSNTATTGGSSTNIINNLTINPINNYMGAGSSTNTSSTNSDRSVGGSSYVDQGHLLETLMEFEEEEEEEDDDEYDAYDDEKELEVEDDPTNQSTFEEDSSRLSHRLKKLLKKRSPKKKNHET